MTNRLNQETSPYLLQHAANPVAWQPWDAQALAQARSEDRPILLSIGYSTCHWCHVMARESFEDAEVAAVMNRLFVCIKVDREERPDLDQVYQAAHGLLTGRPGGWPLTVFLTPDGVPFFAGTYFPPHARHGLPGLVPLLEGVARAYDERRDEIAEQNASLVEALRGGLPEARDAVLSSAPLAAALREIKRGYDPVHGGFGTAPKFPRPVDLAFLFWSGDADARAMVLTSLTRMAERGLMDQLGGGFFRYSVDERWAIPHFEKMLYDNGLLLGLYADAWAVSGEPLYARAVEQLVAWLEREMSDPEGGFYAALDADSEHEEGRFYVWTPAAIEALLTPEEYALARPAWGLDGAPNFEGHAWHLGHDRPLAEVAAALAMEANQAEVLLASARARLFAAREGRVRPGRDEKCLTAWNALAIKGLARAARRFDRPDWLRRAQQASDCLHARVWREGRLKAVWTAGQARHNAYLDDHAFLLDALLELLQAEWRGADLAWAEEIAEVLLRHFHDPEQGGFFFTSHDHEALIHRDKPAFDNATPACNGVAARALLRLGHVLDEPRYSAAAESALTLFAPAMQAQPMGMVSLLGALREALEPSRQICLRGPEPEISVWKRASDRLVDDHSLLFKWPNGTPDIPTNLAQPPRESVNATICEGVTCLPEISQLPDLLGVFRSPAGL